MHERRAQSTTLSGDSVTVQAGNDLNIIGSNVAGTQDVNLAAGNQLTVTTADEARHETHFKQEKKSGLMGTGGIGFTVGKASQKSTTDIDSNLNKGSTVGSSQGSVTFNAGKQLNLHGSDVVAGRDMQLSGQNINITSAENSHTAVTKTEQKQSGLTVALSGTAGGALNSAVQTVQAARSESDSRIKALQGTKAALSAVTGAQAGKNAVENNSLAGDKARQSVKESKEWWQAQVREKLGEDTASQLINGALNAVGDTGDFVMAGGDYALDGAMALASCATGSNYCQTALNDVEGKNQAVAGSVKSLMNGESWQAIKATAKKASEGDQRALEAMGSILVSVMTKKSPTLDKVPVAVSKTENSLPQWSAGEGKFSPKDQGKVTNVENPTSKPDAKSLPYKDTVGSVGKSTDYVDILSPEAKKHILYGDSPTSGGHIFPGNPGKTTFPSNWTKEKIVHEIGDIATSPKTQWYAQSGTGGLYTKSGKPARWVAWEVRDGVRMRVIYEPANGKVITAFPDNVSKPAATLKPIK